MRDRAGRRDRRSSMRDRAYDRARGRRSMRESDGEYLSDSARRGDRADYVGRGGSRRDRMYSDGRRGRDSRDRKYDDYEDYRDFEYNSDRADEPMELDEEDLKEWCEMLENSDGTKGPKFNKDQILPLAEQHGVKFKEEEFTEDEFVTMVNVMYSDYSEALQKASLPNYNRPEPYIHLAKAWLCDEDFEGEPYEKMALYFYSIVEYDG